MRTVFALIAMFPLFVQAQSVGVKDIPAGQDTTIEIKKGTTSSANEFEIVSEEEDIEGDAASLLKEARANWKSACAEWKKDLRELNKEEKVLSRSCGKMICTTESMESTCRSKAKYKLKVRVK